MIPDSTKEAFTRLIQPEKFKDMHEVVLLECTDAVTGLPVHAVCAILKVAGGVNTVPIAVMTSPDIRQRLIPPATLEFS
jgi:hypothetical protein